MRISIIGHSGSGKSTLAKKISEKLNIPHFQIDRFWFEAGGGKIKSSDLKKTEKVRAYIKEKVESFAEQDSWVSDGWYSRVQPIISQRADHIIFLQIPLYRRLFNHLLRIFKSDRHPELTKWDDIKYFYEIIIRTFKRNPKMRKYLEEHSTKVKILRNYKETEKYLDTL